MGDHFLLFVLVLFILGIITREDFIFTLLYLLVGANLLSRFWGRKAMAAVSAERDFIPYAFLGEKVPVSLQVKNSGSLPIVWLQVRDSLPFELFREGPFQQVVSLAGNNVRIFHYKLDCRKRGYYQIGPLDMVSGDLLGIIRLQERFERNDFMTVYPKIIPLSMVKLPSYAPMGTLKHNQPIFEDPSRVIGKRAYTAGDSLRRIDWKTSASAGQLQVKVFEPSIALETAIFLNLNTLEYYSKSRFYVSELAIVVAASLANWVISVRQSVGLATNGVDPAAGDQVPPILLPRQGRGHLLRILETLARVQMAETIPMVDLIRSHSASLSWGTTIIVITNIIDDLLFDSLFHARRSGLSSVLIQCGTGRNIREIRDKAEHFGFPIYQILEEKDLDVWRQ